MRAAGAGRRAVRAARAAIAAVAVTVAVAAPIPVGAAGSATAAGSGLLEAASRAPRVVVGTLGAPASVDRHGFAATLAVERGLAGDARPGETLRVAWEQFGQEASPRFRDGTRWLLALDAFPGGSLWLERFPDALRGRPVWVVAGDGGAALADPDPASLDALAGWLALDAEGRGSPAGVQALAAMVERAEPGLALGAAARLDAFPSLWTSVDTQAAAALGRTLDDPARPSPVREALAGLAGRRRLEVLRPALERAARPGSAVRAAALDALAALDGGLADDQLAALLTDPDPAVRAVVLRREPLALDASRLERMALRDPDPVVRQAALGALAARGDPLAVDTAARALVDPDRLVRSEAAVVIASRGEAAVPVLKERAWSGSDETATAAAAALALTGPSGRQALEELAQGHPDERMRRLARFVQGRDRRH